MIKKQKGEISYHIKQLQHKLLLKNIPVSKSESPFKTYKTCGIN